MKTKKPNKKEDRDMYKQKGKEILRLEKQTETKRMGQMKQ